MECFATPQIHLELIEVPLLCDAAYDDGPFLAFPSRQGWAEKMNNPEAWFAAGFEAENEPLALSRFLQRWLCFGLLGEVLERHIKLEELTRTLEQPCRRTVLCTSGLESELERVIVHGQSLGQELRIEKATGLRKCLGETPRVLRMVGTRSDFSDIDEVSSLFLVLLYELLAAAVGKAYLEGAVYYREHHGELEIPSGATLVAKWLKDSGWCPREVWSIIKRYNSSMGYYLSHLSRPGLDKDHSKCTSLVCTAYNIEESSYRIQHIESLPCCKSTPVEVKDLVSILARGYIPVIECLEQDHGQLSIRVLEATSDTEYVAISHVWSDGLGNPYNNAFPQCQLRQLYSLCKRADGSHLPFWIDTLCCPTEPQSATDLAIDLMRKTYADASVVLVLDSWLSEQQTRGCSLVEIMIKIMASGWTRRLWTFQEGMLAKQLWFRFSDQLIYFNEVARAVRSSNEVRSLHS
jgi:hypothetical protein